MIHDRGLNDCWERPRHVRRLRSGRYAITLTEPLGQRWDGDIVTYKLPGWDVSKTARVIWKGDPVACQRQGRTVAILVEALQPGERRLYEVHTAAPTHPAARSEIRFRREAAAMILANNVVAVKLPATQKPKLGQRVPGPIIAARRNPGPWLGQGYLDTPYVVTSITTRLIESGPLWSTAEVTYRFGGGYCYQVLISLRPDRAYAEIYEDSTLPVRLRPAPRPYFEVGSLGQSLWPKRGKDMAKPCVRPCPTANFFFDLQTGFEPDRMITHSTDSWEIMDLPLGSPGLKTYTAMRPALPFIDGGWLGVYNSRRNELMGVASLDIAHWRAPDETLHPIHRTPGANAEVILLDARDQGTHLRFPIENVKRRWVFAVIPRPAPSHDQPAPASELTSGRSRRQRGAGPQRLKPDPANPLWSLRRRLGDLRLDKVKDWITAWPDAGQAHPRLLCRREDFARIRGAVRRVPALNRNYRATRHLHAIDRYIMTGERSTLKAIEEATQGGQFVNIIMDKGLAGPVYAIGLARTLRRYVIACDLHWDEFAPAEKTEARRILALGAYILTDGDWWQYAWKPGETTYLPNFNSDVFTCAGLIGLFLSDHPCGRTWVRYLVAHMDRELANHLRRDGGGEENIGNYLPGTWSMLYFPALWALRQNGIKDYSKDKNVLAGARFLLKTLGPRDPRDNGRRMLPPIGNHPQVTKYLTFGPWLAAFLKQSDKTLAANLMWAWEAGGKPVHRNHDHSGPAADPFTQHYLYHDPSIKPRAPRLESYNLPYVGAVLRSHDAGGQGSYLFLKAGRVHGHHDEDEQSIHYFGRGAPLALDGLRIQNIEAADAHNTISFFNHNLASGRVESFRATPVADYVRSVMPPYGFSGDSHQMDGLHHSGFTREIVLVKAPAPSGVEYVVMKDITTGPDACQWNLDVLSCKPVLRSSGHIWFPGHTGKGFGMGLDVIVPAPIAPKVMLEKGYVNERLRSSALRRNFLSIQIQWRVTEHWVLHIPAPSGTTFLTVLFPRPPTEPAPRVEYFAREEILEIRHAEGRDLVFLRSNDAVTVSLEGVVFRGRAAVCRERQGRRALCALDAGRLEKTDARKPMDSFPCVKK